MSLRLATLTKALCTSSSIGCVVQSILPLAQTALTDSRHSVDTITSTATLCTEALDSLCISFRIDESSALKVFMVMVNSTRGLHLLTTQLSRAQ